MFGVIKNPFDPNGFNNPALGNSANTQGQGLVILANTLGKTFIVAASLYTLFNLIIAGYLFLNANGEAKQVTRAWDKIWQSLVGLLIVAGSFILAAIFGFLIFGDPTILINPRVFTPQL